eukprot:2931428-Alexandrium_andersonii.AAC.1
MSGWVREGGEGMREGEGEGAREEGGEGANKRKASERGSESARAWNSMQQCFLHFRSGWNALEPCRAPIVWAA